MDSTTKLAAIAQKLNAINAEAELALMQEETARTRDEFEARMVRDWVDDAAELQ